MKRSVVLPGMVAGLVTLILASGPAVAQEGWTPEHTLQVRRIGSVAVSPDGRRAAFVVGEADTTGLEARWRNRIYLADLDGVATGPITPLDEQSSSPAWSRDGRLLAFLSSRGDQGREVWRLDPEGDGAERLTDAPGDVSAFALSPDGSRIAYLMAEPDPGGIAGADRHRMAKMVGEDWRRTRLYVAPLTTSPAEHPRAALTPGGVHVTGVFVGSAFSWSPDGQSIAYSHTPTPDLDRWSELDLSVVDVTTGQVHTVAAGPTAEGAPTYSPDGKAIAYFVSDGPQTWAPTGVVHVRPADRDGESRPLEATPDRRPDVLGWSPDGRSIVFGEAEGTIRRVGLLPADGSAPTFITPSEVMISAPRIGASGAHLGFVTEAPDRPPEAAITPLADFQPVRVSRVQTLPALPMGQTEVMRWTSADGRTVEGLLTYPTDYQSGQRVPLLVVLHGGPPGVFTQRFIGSPGPYPLAVFADRGYAILRPNPRGSGGYGQEFRYANREDWGGGDYRDVLTGVDALVKRGIVDADRLGVMGWSYGGYLTARAITQTSRFRAASVGAGITNLVSYAGTADIPSFVPDYFESEHWEKPELWLDRSPIRTVHRITTPTLILHGEDDVRVPVTQGYELFNALRRRGVPAEMVVYPGEPHSLQDPRFQLDAMRRNLEWFRRWLRR